MGDAETGLGVGVSQALVAGVHGGGDVFGLAGLVAAVEAAVEDLEDEGGELVGVDGRVRAALEGVPAGFC